MANIASEANASAGSIVSKLGFGACGAYAAVEGCAIAAEVIVDTGL